MSRSIQLQHSKRATTHLSWFAFVDWLDHCYPCLWCDLSPLVQSHLPSNFPCSRNTDIKWDYQSIQDNCTTELKPRTMLSSRTPTYVEKPPPPTTYILHRLRSFIGTDVGTQNTTADVWGGTPVGWLWRRKRCCHLLGFKSNVQKHFLSPIKLLLIPEFQKINIPCMSTAWRYLKRARNSILHSPYTLHP